MAEGRRRKAATFDEALKANGGDLGAVLRGMLEARQDGKEYLYDESAWGQFNNITNNGSDLRRTTMNSGPSYVNPQEAERNRIAEAEYQARLSGNATYNPQTGQTVPTTRSLALEPNVTPQNSSGIVPGTTLTAPLTTMTGNQQTSQDPLLGALEKMLQEMQTRGQVLNPNVEITPEKAAEFLSQAEREINPYYAGQIKLARESLMSSFKSTSEELLTNESRAEKKYGQDLRTLGENAAELGFAQSGRRLREETDLAYGTQNSINDSRRTLSTNAGNLARTFAQKYGASELPGFNLPGEVAVGAGESTFSRGSQSRSLYQLSPEIYSGLIGSEEFARRGAVRNRTSELEGAYNTGNAINQARRLTL